MSEIAVVPKPEKPKYIRLPYRGACPYTGLFRNKLSRLCIPSPLNKWKPPVKGSITLKEPGQKRGTRLIHLANLEAYLESLEAQQAAEAAKMAEEFEHQNQKAA